MNTGWKLIGRDVYLDPPSIGGSVRVCDVPDMEWVENLSQNSAEGCIHVAIGNGNYAPYGAFSASRTSNGGGIGHMALSYQDLKTPGGGAWGRYTEAFVAEYTHPDNTSFGHEYGLVNKRASCPNVTPYQISPRGIVDGVRIGVGKPGCGGKKVSSLMTFANVEGTTESIAAKGLVFAYDAFEYIKHLSGKLAEVLSFAKGMGLCWYDSIGRRGFTIQSQVDNADYAPHLIATNGAIHFFGKNGFSQFSFNTETGVLYFGNESWNPVPLPQCPGSVGTVTFYVGGRGMEVPCYTARS